MRRECISTARETNNAAFLHALTHEKRNRMFQFGGYIWRVGDMKNSNGNELYAVERAASARST